jgi:hypothetical protein
MDEDSNTSTTTEKYLIVVVQNLRRQVRFLELATQLEQHLITEEEYVLEIDTNPDKYVISLRDITSDSELNAILDVATKLGMNDEGSNEVLELFSIYPESIKKYLYPST